MQHEYAVPGSVCGSMRAKYHEKTSDCSGGGSERFWVNKKCIHIWSETVH